MVYLKLGEVPEKSELEVASYWNEIGEISKYASMDIIGLSLFVFLAATVFLFGLTALGTESFTSSLLFYFIVLGVALCLCWPSFIRTTRRLMLMRKILKLQNRSSHYR